jgi:transcriptional regulator with PAS, ATPase and Fis domain
MAPPERMREIDDPTCRVEDVPPALIAVSAVFSSLGRGIVCLDTSFNILHISDRVASLIGEARAAQLIGAPASELFGEELFGRDATMRQALVGGERREGWRASLLVDSAPRLISLSAAPFIPDPQGICDRRVAYLVVIRPNDEEVYSPGDPPTIFGGLISRSPSMARIFAMIENLQASDATILLTGESGTGKEVIARAVHQHSNRRSGPFVGVNCGALPSELLESELFGHVRGAFTSAVRDRVGRFELAQGGTLFLDEIGDLPLPLQVKLLRVLQERKFERVGESRSQTSDARIIAATNVDLKRAVNEGRFREDLYYRLRVVPIEVPPLRSRREDIEPLARHLLGRVAGRHGRQVRFSPATLRALLRYSWPGNVRELENAIEYAVSVGRGQTIQPEDLPMEVLQSGSGGDNGDGPVASQKNLSLAEAAEADQLRKVLEAHHWRREEAARALGMSRTTLWRKMRELRLER